jgi:hypothetical protein
MHSSQGLLGTPIRGRADAKGSFITYGTIEWLPPVLILHLVLLPLNR